MSSSTEYLKVTIKRLKEYKSLGDKTFEQLSEDQFFFQPDPESNSIALIIQHMHGNMLSRWTNFLTEDGEKEWRKRDEEFEPQSYNRDELMDLWEKGWEVVLSSISSLKEEDLLSTVTIRQKPLSVMDAIQRQLAHYSYHVGQIVYLGKMIKKDQWHSLSIPKKGTSAKN